MLNEFSGFFIMFIRKSNKIMIWLQKLTKLSHPFCRLTFVLGGSLPPLTRDLSVNCCKTRVPRITTGQVTTPRSRPPRPMIEVLFFDYRISHSA